MFRVYIPLISMALITAISTQSMSQEQLAAVDTSSGVQKEPVNDAGNTVDEGRAITEPQAAGGNGSGDGFLPNTSVDDPGVPDANPEMTGYDAAEAPPDAEVLDEDPLDAEETAATMAVIGVDDANVPGESSTRTAELIESLKPYGKGDMELSVGIGGRGGDGFTLAASAVFAYYVIDRLAPGMEMDYQVTFADVKYPQSLTLFPFVKFVLIRAFKVAPYLLVGGGRTFEWGGADTSYDSVTGEFNGYSAVSSWVTGVGGGVMIGMGNRVRIQIQLLAMYRVLDEKIWRDARVVPVTDNSGTTYILSGERTDRYWYPAPSFWLSFVL
ncbi:MAG: hypothetical protein JXR76_08965 [Deltaproteobacteria bacterium]|nr:hypothetical protein [Deltaproteobacteria bacterium]